MTVIKIENLSKLYRLGEIGTGTVSHDLNRWWQTKVRGKEDPYLKIGQVNDRTQKAAKDEHIWAVKDINLEVKQGEILGIIGKNGAGKSTLLKLLSRVTSPTTGTIKTKGRLASLLEVGTGFHPEMTGRENIFMNGTIMGMRKWEIAEKLEEIVEFAGIAKYLDTPTKRYSSGMTVRLGFAIAAFLEPEILVVDEVLAVGDAEFQKKAIGKMQEVSNNEGRTVLFVSHNMGSIERLCNKVITLKNGKICFNGDTKEGIEQYISSSSSTKLIVNNKGEPNYFVTIEMIKINDEKCLDFAIHDDIGIITTINLNEWNNALEVSLSLLDKNLNRIFTKNIPLKKYFNNETGRFSMKTIFKGNFLMPGKYSWLCSINHPKVISYHVQDDIIPFVVHETGSKFYDRAFSGIVFPPTTLVSAIKI